MSRKPRPYLRVKPPVGDVRRKLRIREKRPRIDAACDPLSLVVPFECFEAADIVCASKKGARR
jgi:hypothetical protein